MKKAVHLLFILMTITLSACQKDIPEPETKSLTVSAAEIPFALVNKQGMTFHVRSFVKGNDVFIECMIPNFSFRNQDSVGSRSGKLLVFLDGNKFKEYSSAAFIMKDLKSGKHRITLQIVDSNGQKTSFKREIIVTIP